MALWSIRARTPASINRFAPFVTLEARMPHEKIVGKPYVENPHLRFERGLQETELERHSPRRPPMDEKPRRFRFRLIALFALIAALGVLATLWNPFPKPSRSNFGQINFGTQSST
jgi:hypothetical protein